MYVYTQINTRVKTRENNSEFQFHLNVFFHFHFCLLIKLFQLI